MPYTKPFLKWVGGKYKLLDKIITKFPLTINNYHEPFLGGGSVLFALLDRVEKKEIKINNNIYAYDINEELIYTYKNIQKNPNELIAEVQKIICEYKNLPNDKKKVPRGLNITTDNYKTNKEYYYYYIRQLYNSNINKKSITCSAQFIFLNKTCFRGVYRIGPNGFNVPFGNYSNPEIINEKDILHISKLIQKVIFINTNFTNLVVESGDFIYVDPPYLKIDKNSFDSYTKLKFNNDSHNKLFGMLNDFAGRGIKFIMSNSDTKEIESFFDKDKFTICKVLCKRSINCKNPESVVNEVIIFPRLESPY